MTAADLTVRAVLYTMTDDRVEATVVDENDRRDWPLGTVAEILPRVEEVRDELRHTMAVARGRVPRLESFATGWGQGLIPPEVLESPPDVLVIVPHAALHDLPLHLVAGRTGGRLGENTGVCYVSSQTLFVLCASRNPARRLGIGAPNVSMPIGPKRLVGGGTDVFDRNPEAFHQLPRHLGALLGPSASSEFMDERIYSRQRVKASFRRLATDVVCIVAHGFIDPDNHHFSGLLVDRDPGSLAWYSREVLGQRVDIPDFPIVEAPVDIKLGRSEVLTLMELEADVQASTQLVALLGCSAGSGRVLQGDEPASLAEAFLHVGSPSVLAPSWDSDVEATTLWMEEFFAAWTRGSPKALAARNALHRLLQAGFGPEKSGALTLRGDWL